MQFARSIVIEDLGKDAWVAVKEIFVENGIVVGQSLRQPTQSGGGDLLKRGFVRLVANPTHVQDDAVLRVRHDEFDSYGGGCLIRLPTSNKFVCNAGLYTYIYAKWAAGFLFTDIYLS